MRTRRGILLIPFQCKNLGKIILIFGKKIMDTKKVGEFLKSLSQEEYNYMVLVLQVRNQIDIYLKNSGSTKAEFCSKLSISEEKFEDFVTGNYTYSLMEISKINIMIMELEVQQAQNRRAIATA